MKLIHALINGIEHQGARLCSGHVDLVDTVANVATGGLYGAGKEAVDVASGNTDVLSGVRSGFNQLGPFGSAVYPVSPQAAEAGNLAGAGAGIGGGLGSEGGLFSGGNINAPGVNPATFDSSKALFMGTDAAGNPVYSAGKLPTGGFNYVTAGGYASAAPAIAALTPGSGLGAFTGAAAGQQLGNLLAGAAPQLSAPIGGAVSPVPGQVNPQLQAALLGAQSSEAHKGLAPRFNQRMAGTRESPGIANLNAYYG